MRPELAKLSALQISVRRFFDPANGWMVPLDDEHHGARMVNAAGQLSGQFPD